MSFLSLLCMKNFCKGRIKQQNVKTTSKVKVKVKLFFFLVCMPKTKSKSWVYKKFIYEVPCNYGIITDCILSVPLLYIFLFIKAKIFSFPFFALLLLLSLSGSYMNVLLQGWEFELFLNRKCMLINFLKEYRALIDFFNLPFLVLA